MAELKHKLICWGDYAIPAPLWANWIAWDKSGEVWVYELRPTLHPRTYGKWVNFNTGRIEQISYILDIPPPEPGPWTEQLYWVGD